MKPKSRSRYVSNLIGAPLLIIAVIGLVAVVMGMGSGFSAALH